MKFAQSNNNRWEPTLDGAKHHVPEIIGNHPSYTVGLLGLEHTMMLSEMFVDDQTNAYLEDFETPS